MNNMWDWYWYVLIGMLLMAVLAPILNHTYARLRSQRQRRALRGAQHQDEELYGTMWMLVDDCNGKRLMSCSRTSVDPHSDAHIASAALELVQAIKGREVDITPDELYQHLVGKAYKRPVVSIDIRSNAHAHPPL